MGVKGFPKTALQKHLAICEGLSLSNGLKIVGRNYAWGDRYAAGSTDIGGTSRYSMKTCGQVSKLASLIASHSFVYDAWGGVVEATVSSRRIWITETAYENSTAYAVDSLSGNSIVITRPVCGFTQTDGVGLSIPANTQFWLRHYIKIANKPSGTPTATAIAGGSLSAQAWYYVVTRTERGLESGPTAEFTATAASSNLSIAITIVDTDSVNADFYSVYRSSATGGTKQFLGSTLGRAKRFVDDGSYTVDTTINPQSAATYDFNKYAANTNECSSHVSAFGTGANFAQGSGTFAGGTAGFVAGQAPICVVGDDRSGKSVLLFGDSIGKGAGFAKATGYYPQTRNMFDAAFSDGEINSLNVCVGGSYLDGLMSQITNGAGRSRLKLIPYADWLIDEHGTNDIWLAISWTQLATRKLQLAELAKRFGVKFAITTILPRVTQTTGCVTIAGQTTHATREPTRVLYNNWVRAGSPVDVDGLPDINGTSSPLIHSYIDLAAQFEVNAGNVVTLNGGYWKVPTAPAATFTLSGTPTTSSLPTTVSSMTVSEHISRVVKITSGARSGQYAVVSGNTTSTLTIYNSGNAGSQSGESVPYLSGAPAAGDTIEVYDVMANEGLHPSVYGHAQLATVVRAWLLANVINA